MPDTMRVSLRYAQRAQVSGTSFTVYNHELTSLQPLQPSYRDQLLQIYQLYVVNGVTCETRVVNRGSYESEVIDYHGDGYTIASLTFDQARENKHCKRYLLSTSGNQKTVTFRRTIWLNQYLPKRFEDNYDFWGTASAGPVYSTARGYQYAIGFFSANGTDSMAITMDRTLTFHVTLFNLAPTALSLAGTDGPSSTKPVLVGPQMEIEDAESEPEILEKPAQKKEKEGKVKSGRGLALTLSKNLK